MRVEPLSIAASDEFAVLRVVRLFFTFLLAVRFGFYLSFSESASLRDQRVSKSAGSTGLELVQLSLIANI